MLFSTSLSCFNNGYFYECLRLSNKKRNKINRGIPYTKRRSQYPAVLIGQLAVMDGFHGLDLGTKVLKFYQDNGFKFIFASDEEEMNYMSGIENHGLWTTILKLLGLKKADPIFRKTRLMYFDLIILFSKK